MEFDESCSQDSRPQTSCSTSYDVASEEEQLLINAVLKRPRNILGEIDYQLLSECDAILTFTVLLDNEVYDLAQLQTIKGTRHTIILDRSGSMSGWPIDEVKNCTLDLAERYFEKCNSNKLPINFEVISFSAEIIVHKAQSYEELEEEISKIEADEGTSFSAPFKYLNEEALQGNFCQLKVLFLTDGLDNDPSETEIITKEFKETLRAKAIQSNFSVIGIDDHESSFMRDLSSLGQETGSYDQTTGSEPQEEIKKLIQNSFINYESSMNSQDQLLVNVRSNSYILNRVGSTQVFDNSSTSSSGGKTILRGSFRVQEPNVSEFVENLRHETIKLPCLRPVESQIKIESALEVTVNEESIPDYELTFIQFLDKINSIDIEKSDQEYILADLFEKIQPIADLKTTIGITFHILSSYNSILRRLYILATKSQDPNAIRGNKADFESARNEVIRFHQVVSKHRNNPLKEHEMLKNQNQKMFELSKRSEQLEIKEIEQMVPLDYIDFIMTNNMESDSIYSLINQRMEQLNDGDIKRFRVKTATQTQKAVLKQAIVMLKDQYQDLGLEKPQITLKFMKNGLAMVKLHSYVEI
ncbi:hypothetical protein FGO68_gene16750 [Halteria grandinella]|uniref:VWFA domain-containing protein n=1 Tax=Halteria grandinella TaxID=5974 RepID=A0A8J8T493_HALGN|nr:hypothetical protein FGO68_gene16750 [Halteria grandinella]